MASRVIANRSAVMTWTRVSKAIMFSVILIPYVVEGRGLCCRLERWS